MNEFRTSVRRGLSLLELLASIVILSTLAAMLVPRLSSGVGRAKGKTCEVQRAVIEVQAALWKRNKGTWPTSDLRDVGSDHMYFPEGLPNCPVTGKGYSIDTQTGRVIGHDH